MNSNKISLKEGFDFLFEEADESTTQDLSSKDFSSKDDETSAGGWQKLRIQGLNP